MRRRVALVIVGLACAVIAAAYTVSLFKTPPRASGPLSPVPAVPVSAAPPTRQATTDVGTIPYYLQNDPRWGSETVGGSDESMAAVGCTVTCVAMGLTAIGEPMDPLEVCRKLKDRDGFTSNGLIIWSKIDEITDRKVHIDVVSPTYDRIDTELSRKRPVIVKIMLSETVPHWLLIVGKDGQDYLAINPLNQERTLVKLSAESDKIYALRIFRRV
jgi:hypothetical protein